MQKHIAIISYHTCPLAYREGKSSGGMEVYVLELGRALGKMGYKVDAFTRKQDTINPDIVEFSENFRVIHLKAGPTEKIYKKEIVEFIPEFVGHFFDFATKEEIKYDLLDCHYYQSGMIGIKIHEQLDHKIPLNITFHTLALMKNLVARDQLEEPDTIRIEAEFELVQRADNIFVPSENEKDYITYLYNGDINKINVVPPGVNHEIFKNIDKNLSKKKIGVDLLHKIILFVGRIEPLKGIDTLIYALKILKSKFPNLPLCLLIVGGDVNDPVEKWPEELKKMTKLTKLLNIDASIKFIDEQPQDNLVYYYNSAEVVVMPSHYESYGMVALEAMACGTNIGVFPKLSMY